MYPVLCPRCGIGVSYFRRDQVGPYCGECGWNLDWVTQVSRKPDWFFLKASLVGIFLITISAFMHAISWRGASFLFGIFCFTALLTLFGATKERRRAENLVNSVAQKHGADLSSNAPDVPPDRVLACEVSLRAGPTHVRFKSSNRVVMWIASILPLTLFCVSVRPLFNTEYRLERFPGPGLYLIEILLAVGLWFLIYKTFRQVHPVDLVTKGDISMAKVIPVPDLASRRGVMFEFRDVSGNLVRTERPSNVGLLYCGTYIPVFYDRENPARCIAACDLDCEFNWPNNSFSV
jgi:hypothetical protein